MIVVRVRCVLFPNTRSLLKHSWRGNELGICINGNALECFWFSFFYVIFLQRPLIHIPGGLFAFSMLHAYLFSCGCVFIIYSYVKQQKTMYTQQESEWYREFVTIAFRPGGKQHTFAPFCFSQQGNMANGESSISEIPWLINQKWHCCARVPNSQRFLVLKCRNPLCCETNMLMYKVLGSK